MFIDSLSKATLCFSDVDPATPFALQFIDNICCVTCDWCRDLPFLASTATFVFVGGTAVTASGTHTLAKAETIFLPCAPPGTTNLGSDQDFPQILCTFVGDKGGLREEPLHSF